MTFETTIITGYYFFCALIIWVVVTDVSDTKIQTFHLCMQYKQTMVAYISWRILHAVFIIISLIQKKKTGTCVFGTKQNVRIEGRKSRWPAREWM